MRSSRAALSAEKNSCWKLCSAAVGSLEALSRPHCCFCRHHTLLPATARCPRRQYRGRPHLRPERDPQEERGAELPAPRVAPRCRCLPARPAGQDAGGPVRAGGGGVCAWVGAHLRLVWAAVPSCSSPCSHPPARRAPISELMPLQVINKSMAGIVKSLDSALKSNNLEKVASTMDQVRVGCRVGGGEAGSLAWGWRLLWGTPVSLHGCSHLALTSAPLTPLTPPTLHPPPGCMLCAVSCAV